MFGQHIDLRGVASDCFASVKLFGSNSRHTGRRLPWPHYPMPPSFQRGCQTSYGDCVGDFSGCPLPGAKNDLAALLTREPFSSVANIDSSIDMQDSSWCTGGRRQ